MTSNDSDLVQPIRIVCHEVGVVVGIIHPGKPHHRSAELMGTNPTFLKQIRAGPVRSSQPSHQLSDAHGVIVKPSSGEKAETSDRLHRTPIDRSCRAQCAFEWATSMDDLTQRGMRFHRLT